MKRTAHSSAIVDNLEDSPIIEVLRLGQQVDGIIPLWLGESCFSTDDAIIDAATDAMKAGQTFYTPNHL